MTHGKRIPRNHDDQIWSPPSLQYDSSHSTVPSAWWLKTEGDIHIDMCSPIKKRPTNVLKNSKNFKNKKEYIMYSCTCLYFLSCISSFTIPVSKVLKCWYFSRIHQFTYTPLFSLLQIQWKPRPVLTRTQSKSFKMLIFLFTPIFFF
jgi:hypothetical protein